MRKLVTVRKINNVYHHPNADRLDVVEIDGWTAVVTKDKHKIGDYIIFFEIDSFLPVHHRYEFLRKGCYKNVKGLGEGFRIKTQKLRGIISQGLVMSLDDLDIYQESDKTWKYTDEVGHQHYIHPELEEDLSRIFGVIKYEPPVPASLTGKARGNFPSFVPKTDQNRIQNLLNSRYIDEIRGYEFEMTVKLDGTSMTVYSNNGQFGVCSRNLDLKLDQDGNSYVNMAKDAAIEKVLTDGFAVQGELYGENIQKNADNLKGRKLYIFDVFDINKQTYLTPEERKFFFDVHFSDSKLVEHVPILGVYKDDNPTLEKFLEMADNVTSLSGKPAEGIVFKRMDGKFSFKVISNNWLLETDG